MRFAAIVLACMLPLSVGAQGADLADLRADLASLRGELADVQALIIGEGEGTLTPSMGPALIRLDQLEQDLRQVTGQLESVEQRIRQTLALNGARLDALEVRIDAIDGQGTALPATREGADAAEVAAFQGAVALGLTQTGMDALNSFLNDYPASVYTPDAKLRTATYLAKTQNWSAAGEAYLDVFSKAPRGPLASDALLGMAQAFGELGNTNEACLMYFELEERAQTPAFVTAAKTGSAALECE